MPPDPPDLSSSSRQPIEPREGDDGRPTQGDQHSDLVALNQRFPMRRRSPAAPIARRHSHDATGLHSWTRKPPPPTSTTPTRESHQFELRPIQSRTEEPSTILPLQNDNPGSSSEEEVLKRSTVKTAEATSPQKEARLVSVREEIRDRFQRKKAKRRRRQLGKTTWTEKWQGLLRQLWQQLVIQGLLRRKPLPPTQDGRHVPLNPESQVGQRGLIDERSQQPYISNFIRSSRYTVWDFVPAQLLFQFSKLGNFYFLVVGILQVIPGLSTVGTYTTIAPLAFFIVISMAKEGYDDYRRYVLDRSENRSVAWVWRFGARQGRKEPRKTIKSRGLFQTVRSWMGTQKSIKETAVNVSPEAVSQEAKHDQEWMAVEWQQVQVGDVVRLRRDEAVPADIVLLHATGPHGVAYIETMALDGETNLKSKQACALLAERCNTPEGLRNTKATIVSEDPNLDLYSYDGRVTVHEETMPLSLNNVVYRGSTLRNTAEACGIVVNSGEECKIRMNANKHVQTKKPAMQFIINKMVLLQIVVVLMLTVGLTIGYALWEKRTENHSWYLYRQDLYDAGVSFKEIFFGFLIMFNTLIPLSLYIAMEIIKIGQLLLLQDAEMYDPASNTPMVANTTTILENLGQVDYVFSDKTGTLTENVMRFRKMSVAGVACLHDMDVLRDQAAKQKRIAALEGKADRKGKGKEKMQIDEPYSTKPIEMHGTKAHDTLHEDTVAAGRAPGVSGRHHDSGSLGDSDTIKTEHLLDFMSRKPSAAFSRKAKHFLLCIALCHTCLPEGKEDGTVEFQAASPDELALVEAAKDLGYLLVDRGANTIKLQTSDPGGNLHVETYEVLDVIEFSSKRKRMSVVVRMPDGRICVLCKGADNVITSCLRLSEVAGAEARQAGHTASLRRASEQDKEIRRMSAQLAHVQNSPRNSMALSRPSLRHSLGRRSTERNRLSQQEAIASWLDRRHTMEMNSPRQSVDGLRTPRPSMGRMPSLDVAVADRRLEEAQTLNESAVLKNTFHHTNLFAAEGLRTLLYGSRYIDEESYASWKDNYQKATTSLVNRQQLIEEAGALIETKLELVGATAIEDKLQEGVADTMEKLRRAKIKVWMLTGDKRETAINIGHSARVCKSFSEIYTLDHKRGDLRDKMSATLNEVGRGMVPHSVVVVDGATLSSIDAQEELAVLFYDLVIRVDSVICCRASPSQKAKLVKAIRRYVPKSMTLAIGDGANDIGMIQASHVGIGISGREGLQAARISDYSIAQFRFLQKLLFVHGRWNYLRTGKYVLATFWKEMLFFLAQAHFQRYNGYTGTSLFESASLTVFNTLFTSLPVILMGIFDQDLRAETLLDMPELYTFGQDGLGFSFPQYFGWMFMGAVGSVINYYFTYGNYRMLLFDEDTSLYAMGVVCFTAGVIFINIKLLILELHTKTVITMAGFLLSVFGWFLWLIALSGIYTSSVNEYPVRRSFTDNFGRQLIWWANVGLNLATLTVLELVVQAVRRVYWPTDQDLMQRIEKRVYGTKSLDRTNVGAVMQNAWHDFVALVTGRDRDYRKGRAAGKEEDTLAADATGDLRDEEAGRAQKLRDVVMISSRG